MLRNAASLKRIVKKNSMKNMNIGQMGNLFSYARIARAE